MMRDASKRTLRRTVKKNTKTLIAAHLAVLATNRRMAASLELSQPSSNLNANDLELSDDERNTVKAWNDVWISMEKLTNEMKGAGWIDAKPVQTAIARKLGDVQID